MTLTAADADAMVAECPAVLAASPIVAAKGAQVVAGNQNWSPDQILGVNASYLTVRNWQIEKGDFFTHSDDHAAAKVCVIGATVAENLFQTRIASAPRSASRIFPSRSSACWRRKGRTSSARTRTTSCWPPRPRSRSASAARPSTTWT